MISPVNANKKLIFKPYEIFDIFFTWDIPLCLLNILSNCFQFLPMVSEKMFKFHVRETGHTLQWPHIFFFFLKIKYVLAIFVNGHPVTISVKSF